MFLKYASSGSNSYSQTMDRTSSKDEIFDLSLLIPHNFEKEILSTHERSSVYSVPIKPDSRDSTL